MSAIPLDNRQQGASLIVALVFLLVLTAAGITAMRFATMEERMASNTHFQHMAHQLAQSEIRAQLGRFNTNAAGRVPLLTAQNATAHGLTNAALATQALPDTSKAAVGLTAVIAPAEGDFPQHTIRYLRQAPCDDGSSVKLFTCTSYEVATTAQLSGGTESSQTQGIVFMSNQ